MIKKAIVIMTYLFLVFATGCSNDAKVSNEDIYTGDAGKMNAASCFRYVFIYKCIEGGAPQSLCECLEHEFTKQHSITEIFNMNPEESDRLVKKYLPKCSR